jgi:hypothetical protein
MAKFSEKISGDCSVLKRKVMINPSREGLKLSNISLGSWDKAKEERATARKKWLCDFYDSIEFMTSGILPQTLFHDYSKILG